MGERWSCGPAWLRLAVVGVTCFVAGCAKAPARSGASELTCFPKEAQTWIAETGEPAPAKPPANTTTHVYVDGSGSMAGYINGSTASIRPLQDLLDQMPTTIGAHAKPVYSVFGTNIRPLGPGELARMEEAGFYSCFGAKPCDNEESHLDAVLTAIAGLKSTDVAVVLSDLWLTNSQLQTSGLVVYNDPLRRIFESGRSVAVYGIPAPYKGLVYDLPGRPPYAGASSRALYMLVIGPRDQVEATHQNLAASASSFIKTGLEQGRIHRSLFTLDPSAPKHAATKPLSGPSSAALVEQNVLGARQGVSLQQFVLRRAGALRGPAGGGPMWTGPSASAALRDAVWTGEMSPQTRAWELKRQGRACQESDWSPPFEVNAGWPRSADAKGRWAFSLSPAAFAAGLPQNKTYLVVGEVTRRRLSNPNSQNEWMRSSGWSFDADDVDSVIQRRPTLFPTLNLSEFARLMETVLAEAAAQKPVPVDGFAAVVKVEK